MPDCVDRLMIEQITQIGMRDGWAQDQVHVQVTVCLVRSRAIGQDRTARRCRQTRAAGG